MGEILKEAILPNKVNLFGLQVTPSLYTAFFVSGFLILLAVIFRIFIFPRFKTIPGRFQALIEALVGYFDNLTNANSHYANPMSGPYTMATGLFICFGTLAELVGLHPVCADLNGCIAMGFSAFFFLMIGGIYRNKLRGVGLTLKEFSMPFSMSFRLFGSLTSGVLATELIYSCFNGFLAYSIILPAFVAVLFTLLHAVMQTYIYTMLVAMFFGEVTEPKKPKEKKKKSLKGDENTTNNPTATPTAQDDGASVKA